MPLTSEAQEVFKISAPNGLYTPARVHQGARNSASYFQGTSTPLPNGLKCKIRVYDVFINRERLEEVLATLDNIHLLVWRMSD